jgi:hypothetical protein
MQPPNDLRDPSPVAGWSNKLLAYIKTLRLVEGVGYKLTRTARGTSLVIEPRQSASGGAQLFRVNEIGEDWLRCRRYNGTDTLANDDPEDVFVARDHELQKSRFHGKTISYSSDGDTFSATYNYTSNTKRSKTIAGTSETQVIVPYYNNISVIIAIKCSTEVEDPTGASIVWQEVTQRAWAKI